MQYLNASIIQTQLSLINKNKLKRSVNKIMFDQNIPHENSTFNLL